MITSVANAESEPFRLQKAIGLPDWFTLQGSYRVRYEALNNPFRSGATGSDQILVERLLLNTQIDIDNFYLGAEFEDSRSQLDDAGTPLGTDDVNTAELLRAYIGYQQKGLIIAGDTLNIQAGRLTIDVGSRRLVARNRFRNTLNAFTGINVIWTGQNDLKLQGFWTMPVNRKPTNRIKLDHNEVEFDSENSNVTFWAIYASKENLTNNINGEVYFYGLNEDDNSDLATRNRHIYTPGVRIYSKPKEGLWDFEIESAYQYGKSRKTTSPADLADLNHSAFFSHVHLAHTLKNSWSPRLVFQYDFASGDKQSNDNNNNRFDTLYGARRFDFGPTGIYGAFARSNISSPGTRGEFNPTGKTQAFIGYRAIWLASSKDSLTTASLTDITGNSGNFVGHQIETRVRYALFAGNLQIEAGGAYLIAGQFLKNVTNAPKEGNSIYAYLQSSFTF